MQEDFFTNDYYIPPRPQVVELIKNLLAWERKHLTLYPKDVMNMLVDAEVLSAYDIQRIEHELQNKPLNVVLPNDHIK